MADISAGAVIAELCGEMFDTSFGTEYPLAVFDSCHISWISFCG
jgi:hypothetical protein